MRTTFEEWLDSRYIPLSGAETPPEGQGQGGMPVAPAAPAEGGSDPGQAASGEGGQGEGGGQAGADALAPLMERMDAMGQDIARMAQAGSSLPGQGQGGQGQAGGEDPSQLPGFLGYDGMGQALFQPPPGSFDPQGPLAQAMPGQAMVPQYDPAQMQQLAAMGLMDPETGQINEQAAQAFLGLGNQLSQQQQQHQALAAQMGAMRLEIDAGHLESELPELQDPVKGEAIVDRAIEQAQAMGNPALAQNPGFIRLVYHAEKAREAAGQETPAAGQQGAELESAAGAGAPAQPAANPADAVVAAGNRGGFWGFGQGQ